MMSQSGTQSDRLAAGPDGITQLDRLLAAPMFIVTLLYLGTAGIAIHLLSDEAGRYVQTAQICGRVLLALTPLYAIEAAFHWWQGRKLSSQDLVACVFPPWRLGARDHLTGTQVWLPGFGWRRACVGLAEELERTLGYPMIGIALLILPLLGFEHLYAEKINQSPLLGLATQLSGAVIWLAFAAEFIVMISLVPRRIQFLKAHWLDLAIICLPLIAFLRALRLMRLARFNQLGRTARVFRLRGLAMRAWRAVLLLEIVDRLVHRDPAQRLKMLRDQIADKETELVELREAARRVEQQLERAALSPHGSRAGRAEPGTQFPSPCPSPVANER